ncbi:tRNA synthetases class I-domain-containing protein [Truncatella angustata]|uniref:Isoleucine--tRNA ligase, mitochondrial n=1 Tax=Truncatella angustata TaxID=152316 RepID=A0A9P8ZZJ3_9PEZI|nr:tRNA synthetases class I-domain-containing protein [Truncatella angustata]KAH6657317.1 tRNA synthetases class I-domain-containing protein [Truncatella angustata]
MSKSWTSTLRLPKSTFPPRPALQSRDQYIKRSADEFYEWQKSNRPGNDTFVLHDGPPYANGNLHVGHALNKILKDMILRTKVQQGRRVDYVPGWDCHGLPIELKALGRSEDGGKSLTPVEIRKSARNLASNTVLKQMKSFRSFGVMADWDRRWTTMDAAYEMRQLRLFQNMVSKGLIYRRYKPVYWSPSSKTALAEAELEYQDDHVSTSAWVRFALDEPWRQVQELKEAAGHVKGKLYAIIWTTTPWTLPANQAIAIHEEMYYSVVVDGEDGYIVARPRLDRTAEMLSENASPVTSIISGKHFKGLQYRHPLKGAAAPLQPIIHADFVTADSGSGLVHLAPGHGFDDYEVCRTLGLPVTAPINDEGKFTADALPENPEAVASAPSINEGGSQSIIDLLGNDVLHVEKYKHKYPYDWRTKKPVVIRATEQWFADVSHIRDDALQALENVRFFPEVGKKRLESFVKGRSEWCISRQRAWGVPIPALYDEDGVAVVSEKTVDHILSVMQERGTSAWWSDASDDPAWIPSGLPGKYRRGTDTMDVWFDSGSSWSMMPSQADVYLEGSDQHRGWFQSSLLTRIAAGAVETSDFVKGAPFKQLITHGFTLDGEGKKMSKSLGNIIEPQQVMDGTLLPPVKQKGKAAQGPPTYDALGSDALRLWAASSDYTKDVAISETVLKAIHTALIKYRTITKMLLGSMHESARSAPLITADHIALIHLQDTMKEVGKAFGNHEFYRGFNALNRWVTNDLSAFYVEASKDRLYCGDGGGVLEPIFNGFMRMLAPMTPSLVIEAWDNRPEWMKNDRNMVHPLHQLYDDPVVPQDRITQDLIVLRKDIPTLMVVHAAIKTGLEKARTDKVVGSSLQSSVIVSTSDASIVATLEKYAEELANMFVVSSFEINTEDASSTYPDWDKYTQELEAHGGSGKGIVMIRPPKEAKCSRCWRYIAPAEDELCGRCEDAVESPL